MPDLLIRYDLPASVIVTEVTRRFHSSGWTTIEPMKCNQSRA